MATDDLAQRLRTERREVFEEYERRWSVQLAIALRERDELRAKLAEAEQRLSNAVDWMKGCGEAQKRAEQKLAEAERAKGEPICWVRITIHGDPTVCKEGEMGGFPVYTAPQTETKWEPVAWIVELGGFRQAMLMPPPEDANVKAIPLYTAPQPQQISYIPLEISSQQITVEQRLRDALEAMGSKKAQSLSAGDLLSVVCDVDAPQITAEDRERARENIRSLSLATDMHITMDGKELDSAIDEAIDTWKEQRRHHED